MNAGALVERIMAYHAEHGWLDTKVTIGLDTLECIVAPGEPIPEPGLFALNVLGCQEWWYDDQLGPDDVKLESMVVLH